jgi:hypothetical protein
MKNGNGQEREHVHARHHHLDGGLEGQPFECKGQQAAQPDRERDRHAEQQEDAETDGQDGQCHDGTTSWPVNCAIMCSSENSVMSTPAMSTGR